MKFHKLISRTVLATALLGATFGGAFSLNASATENTVSNGRSNSDSGSTYGQNNGDNTVSKDFKTSDNTKVDITDGYLNLDSTPQFNFGNNKDAVKNNSDISKANTLALNPSSDSLEVTDYRASSKRDNQSPGTNPTGWSVSVSVGNFNITSDEPNKESNTHPNDWKVNFKSNNTINSDKNYQTTLDNNSISSNNFSDKKPVINGGYGSTNVTDYSSENAPNMATLSVPYNVQPGSYTADMNWNLSTNITSDLNN